MTAAGRSLRAQLSKRLRDLGIEERAWPGRDGFASLLFQGKEFGHFHKDSEIDIRLGKEVILKERLKHPTDSTVHPNRSKSSPWYEFRIHGKTDIDEALRLVGLAMSRLK